MHGANTVCVSVVRRAKIGKRTLNREAGNVQEPDGEFNIRF